MAGIYIHIPFCKKACHYCNFHFSTSASMMPPMVDAIIREMELRKDYLHEGVNTIYIGGGTPSLLKPAMLNDIMQQLIKQYTLRTDTEITLEANPDDINAGVLSAWRKAGINRLSIGIQSFSDEDLTWMNRAHDAVQARNALQLVKEFGFDNVTIDLIYGLPGLTDEKWKQNVDQALAFGIAHISCYALTVEPRTTLDKMIRAHTSPDVDPDQQARQFHLLCNWLDNAGFEQYELSNFAKPGFRSRHNTSYWQSTPYLGLGPSAHSFDGESRQWNIANNALYLQSIKNGIPSFEKEMLTATQQLNEYLMTSLRTIEGISIATVTARWGTDAEAALQLRAEKYLGLNYLESRNGSFVLTQRGKFLADGIAADLFESG